MNFEKAKKLLVESIDEGKNFAEIMEIFTNKVYYQGKQDGIDDKQIKDYTVLSECKDVIWKEISCTSTDKETEYYNG